MSMKNSIKYLIFGSFILALAPTKASAYSYSLNAFAVYKQAQAGNYEYFRLLKRYPRAIDIMDNSGNTAYCIALRNRDIQAMNFLAQQGANTRHSCIDRVMPVSRQGAMARQTNNSYASHGHRFKNEGFFSEDKNIYMTAAGIAAAGGVIALLASSGGGSSGGGGGGPTPPPSPEPEPVGDLTDMTPDEFKTQEYNSTHFLSAINAADAYSHIYQKDTVGNIFGHQAGSTERIAKINVGVLDNGTYPNSELNGDIVKTYDINRYNEQNSIWSYISNPQLRYYVVLKDGKYYGATIDEANLKVRRWQNSKSEFELTMDEVKAIANSLGVPFSSFALVNANGGANPGINLNELDVDSANSWFDTTNGVNHGTHVTGIIAANKDNKDMHGVAFDNAQIYAASWDFDNHIYNTIVNMVDNKVRIINNSWGTTGAGDSDTAQAFVTLYNNGTLDNISDVVDVIKAYAYAANNGTVWVQAAGNEKLGDAEFYAGLGQVDLTRYGYSGPKEHEVPYISVAALNAATATSSAPAGKLASYSNYCGSAKDYCITAPGSDILSTGAANDGALYMDGTSMGTPVVTGSIALLNGYYPWLSAQNIAWLILETANHSGDYANSNIYGRGALDLNAAITTPIGDLSIPSGNDFSTLKSASASKLYLNGTMQASLAKSLPEKVTAFDELYRPFAYKTENLIQATHASNTNFRNKVSHAALSGAKKTIKDEKTGFSFSQSEALNKSGKHNLSSAEVIHEADDGSATRLYYAENSKYMVSENVLTPSTNPYLSMNEAYGAENTLKLNEISKLKLSLQTGENGMYERDYEQDRATFTERSYALNAEYSFNLTDYLELSTLGGMLYEEDAMLGMNGQGGFAIKDGSTYYMGLKAALNLTTNFTLLAAYYRGYTQGQDTSMLALSDIETESYMLAGEYKLSPLHKVGLSLSSPLSIVKGRASFRYASGRDNYSDTIYMQKLTSSLKPEAKEYDLGLYYQGAPQSNLNLLGKVETRFNADGEKGLTDYIGIMGMQYIFPK